MIRYKLTDKHDRTYSGCQWGKEVEHETPGEGELCTAGWIHVYAHPLLAILLNPIHGNFKKPHLWECEVSGKCKEDRGLKEGWQRVKTIKRIRKPKITLTQRRCFAILCAKEFYKETSWTKWANDWLSGKDRTKAAAYAAAYAAADAADAAAVDDAAAAYAAYAADAYAAYAAAVAAAAYAAADAADAAADAAAVDDAVIDLIAIAKQAMRGK